MENIKPGDRLIHDSGTIYFIHAIYPSGNAMIGVGADDRVAIAKEDLHGYHLIGKVPMARLEPKFAIV